MRGEHLFGAAAVTTPAGSSPRARGTRRLGADDDRLVRLIPACAGNTVAVQLRRLSATAHPRVRGEHLEGSSSTVAASGSSPRARGTRRVGGGPHAHERLIPACAGNTSPSATISRLVRGSSPRARGTRRKNPRTGLLRGLIPACAGNTPRPRRSARGCGAHPRVRGEHTLPGGTAVKLSGSSPRARGTPVLEPAPGGRERLIPACAGNTSGPC